MGTRVEATHWSGGSVAIDSGETDSEPILAQAMAQSGFILPAAFTGTGISFKVSHDGETYVLLYDAANALVSVTVTQGRAYAFPISLFGFSYIILVSNAAEDADRQIAICSKY